MRDDSTQEAPELAPEPGSELEPGGEPGAAPDLPPLTLPPPEPMPTQVSPLVLQAVETYQRRMVEAQEEQTRREQEREAQLAAMVPALTQAQSGYRQAGWDLLLTGATWFGVGLLTAAVLDTVGDLAREEKRS